MAPDRRRRRTAGAGAAAQDSSKRKRRYSEEAEEQEDFFPADEEELPEAPQEEAEEAEGEEEAQEQDDLYAEDFEEDEAEVPEAPTEADTPRRAAPRLPLPLRPRAATAAAAAEDLGGSPAPDDEADDEAAEAPSELAAAEEDEEPHAPRASDGDPNAFVTAFVELYDLDSRVEQFLRELSPEELDEVLEMDLSSARKPSAVVTTRIREVIARRGSNTPRPSLEELSPFVDRFSKEHGLDMRSREALATLSVEDQEEVISSLPQGPVRNHSAMIWSRVKAMREKRGAARPSGAGQHPGARAGSVHDFIRRHNLDDRVAQEILALPTAAQKEVITADIGGARNASAVVTSVIKTIRGRFGRSR